MDEDNGYLGETEATLYCLQNEFPVAQIQQGAENISQRLWSIFEYKIEYSELGAGGGLNHKYTTHSNL